MTRQAHKVTVCVLLWVYALRGARFMALDTDTVARVAKLCRLEIQEEDLAPMAEELSHILSWIEQLREVDVSLFEPLSSVVDMKLKTRDDIVTDGGLADDIVRNAPESVNDYFVVPKVIE
jgi:aspartyl-tRNA(Asn)/glutamyl-tRNA(Gln) amidotransferase subunit C